MTKRFLFLLAISSIFWSCGEESEPEDCAGIPGGDTVCGCTDSTATNYDSLATYDDGSCEFLLNGIPIKWLKTYTITNSSGMDESWCVNKVSDVWRTLYNDVELSYNWCHSFSPFESVFISRPV